TEIRKNFGKFRITDYKLLFYKKNKKRPNTIPVFGPGKWLLGESRALKVGINAG
ncbi:hypothetical protein BEJ34_003941, partial [Salmonella enterica subsp. enterica serovar Reading]|nr:hypothetical protein [Salmonella enterica subsp. enterica serovar Reading]EEG5162866.1 hypothetical protein [Salmonella enterica subsp. enterica]